MGAAAPAMGGDEREDEPEGGGETHGGDRLLESRCRAKVSDCSSSCQDTGARLSFILSRRHPV